jgi:DnaJ-class molecular chaperone
MPKANRCRVCGETNPSKWAGANRDLCTACLETCRNCRGAGTLHHALLGDCNCRVCNGRGTVAKDRNVPAPAPAPLPELGEATVDGRGFADAARLANTAAAVAAVMPPATGRRR